jgi:hypothetical protein
VLWLVVQYNFKHGGCCILCLPWKFCHNWPCHQQRKVVDCHSWWQTLPDCRCTAVGCSGFQGHVMHSLRGGGHMVSNVPIHVQLQWTGMWALVSQSLLMSFHYSSNMCDRCCRVLFMTYGGLSSCWILKSKQELVWNFSHVASGDSMQSFTKRCINSVWSWGGVYSAETALGSTYVVGLTICGLEQAMHHGSQLEVVMEDATVVITVCSFEL